MCPAASCCCLFETFKTLKDHHRSYHITTLKQADETRCCINVVSAHDRSINRSTLQEIKQNTFKVKNTNKEKRKQNTIGMTQKRKSEWSKRLMCNLCKRKFTNVERRQHHETHHNEMIYKCFCGNMFLKSKPLISHSYHSHGILLSERQCYKYGVKKEVPKLRVVKNTATNRWSSSLTQSVRGKSGSQHTSRWNGKKCHLCNRRFVSTFNTLYHIAHHRQMTYKCPCGNQFMYFRRLKQHALDTHKVAIPDKDESHFQIKLPLVASKTSKKNTPSCTCQICKRKFRRKENLESHLKHHNKMIYKCPDSQCGYLYLQLKYFQKHVIACHNLRVTKSNEEQYKMKGKESVEGKTCRNKQNNMSSGMVGKGVKPTDLKCHLCRRKFQTLQNKDFHVRNHDKMVYGCPDPCGFKYMKFSILNKHAVSCHGKSLSETEPFQAPNNSSCAETSDRVLPSKELKQKPEMERPKCHLCQRRFVSYADKLFHLKHHEEMKYKCPDPCGNLFLTFECMRKHIWTFHRGGLSKRKNTYYLKKFSEMKCSKKKSAPVSYLPQCNICQRRFSTVKGRDEHLQRHGEMQFKCPEPCGSMFLRFSDLQDHVRNRHQFRLYQADKDGYKIEESPEKQSTTDDKETNSTNEQAARSQNPQRTVNEKDIINDTDFEFAARALQESCSSILANSSSELTQLNTTSAMAPFEATSVHAFEKRTDVNGNNAKQLKSGGNIPKGRRHEENDNDSDEDQKMKTLVSGNVSKPLSNGMIYECPMVHPPCKMYFKTFYTLQEHCVDKHKIHLKGENQKTYRIKSTNFTRGNFGRPKCGLCGRVFRTEERRIQHVKNHGNLMYTCSVNQCEYLYDNVLELRYHWRDVHKLKFRKVDVKRCLRSDCHGISPGNFTEGVEDTDERNAQEKIPFPEGRGEKKSVREGDLFNSAQSNQFESKSKEEGSFITDQNDKQLAVIHTGLLTGSVVEKDGCLVGFVDVHATEDGTAVQPQHMDDGPSGMINQKNCSLSKEMTQRLNTTIISVADNSGSTDVIEFPGQSHDSDGVEHITASVQEDAEKLDAETHTLGNGDSLTLTEEPLNSTFDIVNSLLDTDLLETFISEEFSTLLPVEDPEEVTAGNLEVVIAEDSEEVKAEDSKDGEDSEEMTTKDALEAMTGKKSEENETESNLQILNFFSPASDSASPTDDDVLGEHSYALPHRKPFAQGGDESGEFSCWSLKSQDSTNPYPVSSALSSLLDGVYSDVAKLPDLYPSTKNSVFSQELTTPVVDAPVDSGLDDLYSVHSPILDPATSQEDQRPRNTEELQIHDGSGITTEVNNETG